MLEWLFGAKKPIEKKVIKKEYHQGVRRFKVCAKEGSLLRLGKDQNAYFEDPDDAISFVKNNDPKRIYLKREGPNLWVDCKEDNEVTVTDLLIDEVIYRELKNKSHKTLENEWVESNKK